MENFIYYYYNIEPENLNKQKEFYYFWYRDDLFYFCLTKRNIEDVNSINDIINRNGLQNHFHLIIKNRYQSIISEYENNNYVLIKINGLLNDYYDMKRLMQFSLNLKVNSSFKPNWAVIWAKKVDYMEEQINKLGIGKKALVESFSYYVGLAENAISFYNLNKLESMNISLCHYRLYYPNKAINFLNPLALIVDYKVRDYAEYLKYTFFVDSKKAYQEFNLFNMNNNLEFNDIMLFWDRMLYPSYYFDCFEDSINEVKINEERIIDIISKQGEFELFLKDIYYELRKKFNIPEILWLIKRSN